ncbi:MAG: FAD:protein FMN transferase [Planctomycetes bacterium]|nr:FAD:protein FMN transferase [Planctomycetota bacterium]
MLTPVWAALGGTLLATTGWADSPPKRYQFAQIHMGVPVQITLYAADEQTANQAARAAWARVAELDRILSDYRSDSELLRLCRTSGPGHPVKVSRELLFVIEQSVRLSRRSGGAFDITVGPLVRLWRRARRRKERPSEQRLADALRAVGYEAIRIDRDANTIELLKPNMRLDLGGVAKGYVTDEALKVLRRHGCPRALIDAGGDIVVGAPPPGRAAWRIEVADPPFAEASGERRNAPTGPPRAPGRTGSEPQSPSRPRILMLKDAAVATSGDTYQFVEIEGVRYSHIIDPRTGEPLTTRCSVTVVAPDGLTADGLASAVSVLGPEKGMELIEATPNTAAYLVWQAPTGRVYRRQSRRFADYLWRTKPSANPGSLAAEPSCSHAAE